MDNIRDKRYLSALADKEKLPKDKDAGEQEVNRRKKVRAAHRDEEQRRLAPVEDSPDTFQRRLGKDTKNYVGQRLTDLRREKAEEKNDGRFKHMGLDAKYNLSIDRFNKGKKEYQEKAHPDLDYFSRSAVQDPGHHASELDHEYKGSAYGDRYPDTTHKTAEEKIKASIARNKAKQEKKNK